MACLYNNEADRKYNEAMGVAGSLRYDHSPPLGNARAPPNSHQTPKKRIGEKHSIKL